MTTKERVSSFLLFWSEEAVPDKNKNYAVKVEILHFRRFASDVPWQELSARQNLQR